MAATPGQRYNALKADIWALGVLLYFALTGQFPWTAPGAERLEPRRQWDHQALLVRLFPTWGHSGGGGSVLLRWLRSQEACVG